MLTSLLKRSTRQAQKSDAEILEAFSRALDAVERTAPMSGSYERIEPKIIEQSQGPLAYRMITYHRESEAWYGKPYTDWSVEFMRKAGIFRAGDVVLDVGCNAGGNAILYALLVGPKGRVIGFDPYPWNAEATRFNAMLNGLSNIEAHACGISSNDATIRLLLGDSRITATGTGPAIDAPIKALSGFADRRPNFIKLDCEGAEFEISETPFDAFPDLRYVYMELHGPFIRERGLDPRDCLDRFHAQKLEIRMNSPSGDIYTPGAEFNDQASFYMSKPCK
jgi:FkbM family methyltransferase